MHLIDWTILIIALVGTIVFGIYKSSSSKNLDGYFRSNRQLPWYLVLLSIMGTQASAITFISAPGQAFNHGMSFIQYYFGLPIAMIIIAIFFVPIFRKLNVYTAYEYLEHRFDKRTRTFASIIFLIGRGLSTGISVVAPAIVLSYLFGWDIIYTNIAMGGIVIIYTVSGGAKAVAYTQQLQFIIMLVGMGLAAYFAVYFLPTNVTLNNALDVANNVNKLNIITTGVDKQGNFNWSDKYNIFSGIIGGFFLSLSYFGTDQSQVGRYLTAKNEKETKLGLLMNGVVKIPMQFFILFVGILVFSYYQYNKAPINFNKNAIAEINASKQGDAAKLITQNFEIVQQKLNTNLRNQTNKDSIKIWQNQFLAYKADFKKIAVDENIKIGDDTNYVFLSFVTEKLPKGVVGLLIAMIFLAAWGSIAAALNALASSSLIDIHKPYFKSELSEKKEYQLSKLYTLGWGIFCIIAAQFATKMGSLIEAVNILGSIFYGVMLGLFLVAFFIKWVKAKAVFIAAIISQLLIFYIYFILSFQGFLWLNVIGALSVILISIVLQLLFSNKQTQHL
jgi:solute:Na+ symporter, SSS family